MCWHDLLSMCSVHVFSIYISGILLEKITFKLIICKVDVVKRIKKNSKQADEMLNIVKFELLLDDSCI